MFLPPVLLALSRPLDVAVVAGYLLLTIIIGIRFTRRNRTTEQYFLGARALPGWAIGLSMVGTSISAVTFLAFPAAAYALDWRLVVPNLMMPVGVVLAYFIFIPYYRRGRITSVFEYLEQRYGPIARLYGSVNFLLGQVLRLGIVLYLVSLAVATLLQMDVVWVMIIGGLFITIYTVGGGLSAVVWTDVIQTVVLMVGGAFCLAFVLFELPGGLGQMLQVAGEQSKFSLGEARWAWDERTLYLMVIFGVLSWVQSHVCNQNVIQRYLAAASLREARKATLFSCVFSLGNWTFFFFLGTALFVYYQVLPGRLPVDTAADEVLPHFILTQLPMGVAGLVIAAAIAAAMSSLDSSLNTISLLVSTDLVRRHLFRDRGEAFYLRVARIVSIAAGLFMVGTALLFHALPRESLLDLLIVVGSLITGPILGMFLLGFFTTRVGNRVVLTALALCVTMHLYLVLNALSLLPISLRLPIHTYWVNPLLDGAFMLFAIALSWIWPSQARVPGELTVWGSNRLHDAAPDSDSSAAPQIDGA